MADDDQKPLSPWPIRHKLSRPVPGPEGEVTEISFRAPNAGDVIRNGFDPYKDDQPVTFDEKKMAALMAALSGLPDSSITRMTTSDWFFCATLIARFL